jgi:uncharacterized protein (DUF302 family)
MRILLAAVAVLVSLAAFAGPLTQREGWQVHPTSLGYEVLLDKTVAAIKAEKMGLVTQASASAGAKGQGIDIPGNRVLGVYRNDYARRMLKASIAAGIEAPIRFYVTENDDQTATLSYKTPSAVFGPYMADGGEELRDLAIELDVVFAAIATKAIAP